MANNTITSTFNYRTASKKILGDLNTPVSVYMRVRDAYPQSALMESSDYHDGKNSRSFICVHPIASISVEHGVGVAKFPDGTQTSHPITEEYDTAQFINDFLHRFNIEGEDKGSCALFGYTSFNAVMHVQPFRGLPLQRI